MSFVSYAQNFEDVMLWRALKHIEHGFYVDVGAHDPLMLSVTKAFYDRGWRGINIEPTDQYYRKLVEHRPEDNNIKIAVGAECGELTLYEIQGAGLTTLDPSVARKHQANGWNVLEARTAVSTLRDILESYIDREIHFLKIDIEGCEEQALQGMDFSLIRPWVLVIEATLPLTQISNHEVWEPLVLQAGYIFVYFDGLNRFYVANEHSQLAAAFSTPPNRHFDNFILASEHNFEIVFIQTLLNAANERIAVVEREWQQSQDKGEQLWKEVNAMRAELNEAYQSWSWRLTRPLRSLTESYLALRRRRKTQ